MNIPLPSPGVLLPACLAVLMLVSACARPERRDDRGGYGANDAYRQPAPAADTYARPATPAEIWSTGMNPTYYRRDAQGNVYYLDRRGGSYLIERRERGMNVTDGDVYYLRGYSLPYFADPEGRLYSTSPGGRLYLEDATPPGEVIDPLSIKSGGYRNPVYGTVPSSSYCAETWQRCASRCEDLPRAGARSACMEDCAIERDRCERR